MVNVKRRWALITGASRGIGYPGLIALTHLRIIACYKKQCRVVLEREWQQAE